MVITQKPIFSFLTAWAIWKGSSELGGTGADFRTAQKEQDLVQYGPNNKKVAVPLLKHST